MMRELETDILIVGGGTGGVAAALACARLGVACIVTEPTDWLGGQLTAQGVPPDENQWVETFGANASYQALRTAVRASALREGARERAVEPFGAFNPGGGWVSRCCAEPSRWHACIVEALAPFVERRLVRVLLHHEPLAAELDRDHVRGIVLRDTRTAEATIVRAKQFVDATELGDLLPLVGAEHHIGAEHRDLHGELHGRTDFDLRTRTHDTLDQQACSWCFAIEHRPGEDHRTPAPAGYAQWRSYVPAMNPPWCGPLFSWTVPSHNEAGRHTFRMVPAPDEPLANEWEMWRYRRIVDASIWGHNGSAPRADVTVVNMVQMDYWLKPLLGVEPGEQQAALAGAREQSLCWLHWMRTEAPRHDDRGVGYPGLRLRGDELGTADGFAKSVYVREPRRLLARTIVHEGHVGTEQRRADGFAGADLAKRFNWDATPYGTGERFADSVAIGHYSIDLHPSCAGRNNVYVPCAPFRVPMGALIPVRVANVIAGGKCLGVSHIVNGAYRMHHVEWGVGEAAGTLAALCVRGSSGAIAPGTDPRAIHESPARVAEVQRVLGDFGVRLAWPWEA
jgi:hypothetical protein